MEVWTVTMEAVYDHGCGGVFASEDAARRHARALADDSDGHHDFRIERHVVGEPVWLDGRWPWGASQRRRTAEVYVAEPYVSTPSRRKPW